LEDLDEEDVDVAREIPTDKDISNDDPLDRLVSETYNRPDDDASGSDDDDNEDELDIEDISSDEESVDGQSVEEQTELDEKRFRRLHVLRSKVDALSTLFLRHLEKVFVGEKSSTHAVKAKIPSTVAPTSLPFHRSYSNSESRLAHFQTLLSIFDRLVLPTFQCRRAQFIVFWCCSLDSGYTDLFLGLLVSRALYETTQPAVNRVAAASYIASFVSRAKYIDDDQVRTVVQYLTAYIDGILSEARADPMAVAASGGLTVFYTVCQAVMMIFCFRWRALQSTAGEETMADEMEMDDVDSSDSEEDGWMADMAVLQKAVFSQLNPLMVSLATAAIGRPCLIVSSRRPGLLSHRCRYVCQDRS
jgi:RNA polymerase I-specific transcription initiation factor RRN3